MLPGVTIVLEDNPCVPAVVNRPEDSNFLANHAVGTKPGKTYIRFDFIWKHIEPNEKNIRMSSNPFWKRCRCVSFNLKKCVGYPIRPHGNASRLEQPSQNMDEMNLNHLKLTEALSLEWHCGFENPDHRKLATPNPWHCNQSSAHWDGQHLDGGMNDGHR